MTRDRQAALISKLVKQSGLTPRQLGDKLNIRQDAIVGWMGGAKPSGMYLARLQRFAEEHDYEFPWIEKHRSKDMVSSYNSGRMELHVLCYRAVHYWVKKADADMDRESIAAIVINSLEAHAQELEIGSTSLALRA